MPATKSPLSLARVGFALLVLCACYETARVETALAHGDPNASLTIVIAAVRSEALLGGLNQDGESA